MKLTPATTREKCEQCQGNGEIVTDWDRYLHSHDGDVGDEAVAECPNCGGEGVVYSCFSEYACIDAESGCDLCERRCDWCRPAGRAAITPEPTK